MLNTVKFLKKSKNIAIFSHKGPDPDAIGSALALFKGLKKMGKDVSLFCDDELTGNYDFLEGFEEYNKTDLSGFDLCVSVDVASGELLGRYEEQFSKFETTLKIDHHVSGTNFAKHNLVKLYSACAIVVYEILKNLKIKIDKDIATCLYFGICGDTGIFKNNNIDSKTFLVCSELLELGADFRKVYSEFFEKRTLSNLYLTSNAIMSAFVSHEEGFSVMTVSSDDYDRFGADENEHIGNLPHSFLSCGHKISAILKQKKDGIHVSLRSKFEYDVSKIAAKFGGGGHKNASGCLIIDSLHNAEKQIIEAIKNYLKETNKWKQILKSHKALNFCQLKKSQWNLTSQKPTLTNLEARLQKSKTHKNI